MAGNVGHDQRKDAADYGYIAPPVDQAADGAAAVAAEQRRPVRIGIFQIIRDHPGIDHRVFAVEHHRDLVRSMRGNRRLLGEAPWNRIRGQSLVRERHPRPPAERAERTRRVGADQFVEF